MAPSRRQFIAGGLCGCVSIASSTATAELLPTNLQPLIGPGYVPADDDERGLWQSVERLEQELAESELLYPSQDLQPYIVGIVERLIDRPVRDLRVYVVRDSSFNASMFPNGMMLVHTGFLVRVHDEAQCAAVLGHEAGHYFRKHTLARWRDQRRKGAAVAFVSATAGAVAGYSALQGYDSSSWIDLANAINQALVQSIFTFSRSQETEADAYGLGLLASAGYEPSAAATVWAQLTDERKISAAARGKKYRDHARSAYSTHPPNDDRMHDLAETASGMEVRGEAGAMQSRKSEWRAALAPHLGMLLEEQIKLNDPGASLYLVNKHASDGWNATLRYYEGEIYRLRDAPGDIALAGEAYSAAIALPDAPADAWRAHGYILIKLDRCDEGRQSLGRYLELRPDAKDAAMVRFALQQ